MIQTGIESKVKAYQIIENQLPAFILDESPKASEFLKQYYISQEYPSGPSDISENFNSYINLDNLTPEVIVGFTSITSSITSTSSTINVLSTKGFPQYYGLLKIDDEIITYTGITTNSFTGCVRGFSGITSYRDSNNPEELVFSETTASSHTQYSSVQNLSSLFLKEFYNKIKYSIAPGLENVDFVSDLNVGNFLKEARSFYQSKGTEESFKILYKVLYGVTPKVIDLEQFLFKPSDSEYIRRVIILTEAISGNPNNLVGQTIYSSLDTKTSAAVSEVEILTRKNKVYYKLGLFIGYSDQDLIEGDLTVTANTKVIGDVSIGSSIITVDSTIGFEKSGTAISGNNTIVYTDKTVNQLLNCSGISENISNKDSIRSNQTIFGFENGNLDKKVELKVCSIISNLQIIEDKALNLENEKIYIKHLGDLIKNPSNPNDRTYKQIFANSWVYNTSCTFEVDSFNLSSKVFTLKSDIDSSSLKVNDRVDIINAVTGSVRISNAKVTGINGGTKEVTLSYVGYTTSTSIPHLLRRIIKKTSSELVPLKYGNDTLFADVQNVYSDDANEFMYVASNSLPSYTFRLDATPSKPSIRVGTASTFIGAATTQSGAIQKELSDDDYSIISFPTSVPFLTGDAVIYSPETTPISGLATGKYFVKVLTDPKQIKLYASNSFIQIDDYIRFNPLSPGVGGKHSFVVESKFNKNIEPQKLLRKFPLREVIKDNDGVENDKEFIGMLVNGVEIKNYKSQDKIYYGPLKSISILNSGIDYDVVNPPQIIVSGPPTGSGTTSLVQPVISGSVKEVLVDPQNIELEKVISLSIQGGNGSGCLLEPIVEKTFREVDFDARLLSNFGGVGETAETITFLSNHEFSNGEAVVYKSNGNSPVSIGTYLGSNADQNRFLLENATYFVRVLNNKTVRLYPSFNDYITGINTVGFTTASNTGIHKFRTYLGKKTLKSIKVLDSGSGYQNRKLYVKPVGISTIEHTISFTDHNFKEGDIVEYQYTGTPISGLSTSNRYYIIKKDNDSFRLADAGIGATISTNYTRNIFTKFSNTGSGYHIFKYPDVSVTVNVAYGSTNVGVITCTPIVRGSIVDLYLYESGSGYGSTVLNFERKPNISIKNGKDATLYPVVLAGKIVRVDIRNKGTEYYSTPSLTVVGEGSGAVLRPIINNGQIVNVVVINSGIGYTQSTTSIKVVSAGRNAKLETKVRDLTLNDAKRYGSEYLHPKLNTGLEYCNISYLNELATNEFNDNGSSHSPIIGWAYDGNPIYGPYGYRNPINSAQGIVILKPGYVEDTSVIVDRPSGFVPGFFVEDYKFDNSGDLDIHNGRFCKTPDFPNGTYAYFAGITTDGLYQPKFPYFIGNRFRSLYAENNLDQDFDFSKSDLVRNTYPYKISDEYSQNDFIIEDDSQFNQESIITSIEKGQIKTVEVTKNGIDYKLNDALVFDNSNSNAEGASAVVSSLKGKTITSIASSTIEYSNAVLTWEDKNKARVYITPFHVLNNRDIVSISGLSTFVPKIAGNRQVSISTDRFTVFKDIPSNPVTQSGLVTDIYISTIPNTLSIGSSIGIGTEIMSVLNIFSERKLLRVKRGVSGTSHTTSTLGFVYPNFIEIGLPLQYFDSDLNSKVYFNPNQSVGVGTTSGVGVAVTYSLGELNYQIDIPTQSIYLPDHPFKTNQRLIIRKKSGDPISVSNTETSSPFNLLNSSFEYVYAINKSKDYIGIVTQVGLTTNTKGLFFRTNGSNNFEYSFEPTYNQITCTIQKNDAVVSVSTAHGLIPGDSVTLNVVPNQSVGIGTSTAVKLKFASDIQKLLVNPVGFNSYRVNPALDTINITSHSYKTGDKVYYSASDLVSSGLSTGVYYVYRVDKDNIKLTITYEDSVSNPPVIVSIASTGGSNQALSLVNPKLQPIKGNNLVFDLSDSSLSGYNFNLYSDKDFNNKFVSIANTSIISTIGVGTVGVTSTAKLTLNYSELLPNSLFYNIEKSGYISTADVSVRNYCEISFINSYYNQNYSVVGVGTTTFIVSLSSQPENTLYNQNNTSALEYSTTSKTASGPIDKISVNFSTKTYKTLPGITSIITDNGRDANLFVKSNEIGKVRDIRIIEQSFEYPSDNTLRPEANIPPTIKLKDSLTIDSIEVIDGGRNYSSAPEIVIVDDETGEKVNSGILVPKINSNSISSVEIFESPTGLSFNSKTLFTTNNSNGVGISTIQSSASGIVTCFLTTPLVGFTTNVFNAGDLIFVEGITKNGVGGSGFNSEDYGYTFFTVSSYENLIPAIVRFNLSGYTANPGIADTIQGSYATITKYSNYPKFKVNQKRTEFLVGENLYLNNLPSDLYISAVLKDYIKISGRDSFKESDIVRGTESGSVGTISEIIHSRGKFNVGYGVTASLGWKTNSGQLNNDIQVLPDNDYYQNLSYSVKSTIQYKDSIDTINRLLHTTGLKNFVDTEIISNKKVSIGSTSVDGLIIYDVSEDKRVDTIYGFALSKDTSTQNGTSKFLKTFNKKFVDGLICKTNRVLSIDDVSDQFTNKENVSDTFIDLDEYTDSFARFLVQIRNTSGTQIALYELLLMYDNNQESVFTLRKGYLSNTGLGITFSPGFETDALTTIWKEEEFADVTGNIDTFDVLSLRFTPNDPYDTDYDIKFIKEVLNPNVVGVASTSIGLVKNLSTNTLVSAGSTATIFEYPANQYDAVHSMFHISNLNDNTMNFVEVYLSHDGTNTYLADYYFDSNSSEGISFNDFGEFDASLVGGTLTLKYTNPTTSQVRVLTNAVGFGSTSAGIGTIRFINDFQPEGTERSAKYQSNYVVGTGVTTILTCTSSEITSIKSLVSVSYGSTYALHQILTINADGTDVFSTQYPFLSVGSTTGIGTFGADISSGNVRVRFFPDASVTGIVTIKSYNEIIYTDLDLENSYPEITYGFNRTQSIGIGLFDSFNSKRINKTEFELEYNNTPIFTKEFNPQDSSILNPATGKFTIPNHFFSTGEALIYKPGSTIAGVSSAPVGIGLTADSVGVVTNRLPYRVWAIKDNNTEFRIATRPEYATAGISVTFTTLGSGNAHIFEMVKKNEKTIIAVDDVIQSPLAWTPIVYTVDGNGGFIGTGATVFSISGISSIVTGDIIRVEDEYMKVAGVGLGTTSTGPISTGTIKLVNVERGFVGTVATSHMDASTARVYKGSYNIVGNKVFFTDPPKGSGLVTLDDSGLPRPFSKFNGRVFLRQNYENNLIYDDISQDFTGIGQTFRLTIAGVNTSGIETGSGLVLINGLFQTPTTVNNAGNNFFYGESAGISSITFTGITSTDGTKVTSISDVNQNQFPRGGLIVSLGSTNGLGFAPLVGASVTAVVGAGGSIVSVGLGSTDILGSGYNGLTAIGVSVYQPGHTGVAASIRANVGAGGSLSFTVIVGGNGYTANPDILVSEPTYENLQITGVSRLGIGSTTTTGLNALISLEVGPNSNPITSGRNADAARLILANKTLIGEVAVGRMLAAFPAFTVPGGNQNCIDDIVDVLECITYNLQYGGNDSVYDAGKIYIDNAYLAGEEAESIYAFQQARDMAIQAMRNESITIGGYSSETQVFDYTIEGDISGLPGVYNPGDCADVASAITTFVGIVTYAVGLGTIPGSRTIAPGSLFEVSKFIINRPGYAFEIGDVFKPVGLVTAKGLVSPVADFQLTVLDVYYDKFASWQFGQLDFIDSIKPLQNGTRSVFPLRYNSELVSFEKDEKNNDSALIDLDAVLLVFLNGVLQEPKSAYIFDGGSSIQFISAPKVEDNISIFFYNGTRGVDSEQTDILETIKIGDSVFVNRANGISTSLSQISQRTVYDIPTSDTLETDLYQNIGIDEFNYRSIDWSKQKRDLIINGDIVYKDRDSLEGQIYPTARVIKTIQSGDNEIFVDNARFFNYEEDESSINIPSFDALIIEDKSPVAAAISATVSVAGTVSGLTITNAGFGYTTATVSVKFSAPKRSSVGVGTTAGPQNSTSIASATATIVNGSVSSVTLVKPGFGYTSTNPPQILVEQPKVISELVKDISIVQGFSGIITGITTTAGIGTALALKFFVNAYTDLQVGYHIFVSGTNVGSGVTSIYSNNSDVIGVGTQYVDNIYRVSALPALNEIVCNIRSNTVTTGIQTLGTSIYNPNGYYSWGRLSSLSRASNPISIGVSGRTINSGLSTFPTIQRRGYGLRDNGSIRKILPD
jgi:hypothetical protein